MIEEFAKFEAVNLDSDVEKDSIEKYNVRAMPDLRILKSDGTEVHTIKRGFLPPDEMVKELEAGLAKAK